MATGTIKYCDACTKSYRVKTYTVTVAEEAATHAIPGGRFNADLCPKDLERLKRFIRRGLTPPTEKKEAGTMPFAKGESPK